MTMGETFDRNALWTRKRELEHGVSEGVASDIERITRVVCDGWLPNPDRWAVSGCETTTLWVRHAWSVSLTLGQPRIACGIVNEDTGASDWFGMPDNYPHDCLIADVWSLLVRAGFKAHAWPTISTKTGMEEALTTDFACGLSGCHGDFYTTGHILAALALYEAISDLSEQNNCAAWGMGFEQHLWAWLQGTATIRLHETGEEPTAEERERIRALANISGVWWADYHYAVPLSAWVARHGAAPGVGE